MYLHKVSYVWDFSMPFNQSKYVTDYNKRKYKMYQFRVKRD